MIILSLDVSSTTIGVAVLAIIKNQPKLIACSYIKPPKDGRIFERLAKTQEEIINLIAKYQPTIVAIEDIAQFIPRKSTANTIITLAVFNRMVGLTVYNMTGKSPEMYSVMTIRHGMKATKKLPDKEEIPALVESLLGIKFPYEYTKKGKIKVESYDMADATILGLYASYKFLGKLEKLKSDRIE